MTLKEKLERWVCKWFGHKGIWLGFGSTGRFEYTKWLCDRCDARYATRHGSGKIVYVRGVTSETLARLEKEVGE